MPFTLEKSASFRQLELQPNQLGNSKLFTSVPNAVIEEFQKIVKNTAILGVQYLNPYTKKHETFPTDPSEFNSKHLQILARNEYKNTTGIYNFRLYGGLLSDDAICRIRHLQKLVVNHSEVKAEKFGGYPRDNPIETIQNGKNFFLIDQAGFQWQKDKRNSGCIFFYPNDNSDQNYQTFQKDMYRVTFQEERPDLPSQNTIGVNWDFDGGVKIPGVIDLNLLKKGFKEEFKQAFLSANHAFSLDTSYDKHCLRFTKAGLGFFANGIALETTHANTKFSQARLEGIAEALEEISKSNLGKSIKFDTLELPFSEDASIENYNELLKKIKTNAEKIQIDNVSLGIIDALKVKPNYKIALTNCADPHAMVGNEGRYGSVDAMIATNCGKSSQNVNVAYNQQFVELSYDSKSLSLSSTNTPPALKSAQETLKQEDALTRFSPSTSPSTSKIRNTTTTNDLKFKITSYGVLGVSKDTPSINDGLKNRRNFVIVDPARTAFSNVIGDLCSPNDSKEIYEVKGANNKTIAQSRPIATESKEGFKIHRNGKIKKIYSGYAVFNNKWQPDNQPITPAGVIHTVGPQNTNGQNHPTTNAYQGPQEILTQALKNIFIEYQQCNAKDLQGNKPGLRIPAISSELCCSRKSGYPEMFNKALTEGYKQACDKVGDIIDFGKHGLEICMYTKEAYKNLKEEIEKTKYKEEKKTISITNKEQGSAIREEIEGNLFHPKSFCITKQSSSKNDYTETIKIPDDNHEHDFFIGQNSDLLKNNDDLSHIIPLAQTINEALKKNLDEAQNDSGLTKEEAAIVILIAIKNKGVSNNIEAFKSDIQLIGINPNDEAFLKKATLFSSSFQQKNNSQSILTGNPEPTNIVGMRLKRLTADYVYEMLTDKSKFDELYQKLQIDKSGNSQKPRTKAMVNSTQGLSGMGAK